MKYTDIKEIRPSIKMIECDVIYLKNIEKVIIDYRLEDFSFSFRKCLTDSPDKSYENIESNMNGTIMSCKKKMGIRKVINASYNLK